jgi:DNA polymerase-3 subunit delta
MPEQKPVVYIFHGDDEYAIDQHIAAMAAKLGDPSMVDLNLIHLDGRTCSDDDLRSAALAMPFLAERRLVVVSRPLARLGTHRGDDVPPPKSPPKAGRSTRERFIALLDSLPDTTALVLVVEDAQQWRRGSYDWDILSEGHWLVKWARQAGERALLKSFSQPAKGEMPAWVRRQAEAQDGQFTPAAAAALAEYLGNDTRLAAQEITKILTYVNFSRPVEVDDVMQLTAQTSQVDMWGMVDALGERNGRKALKLLHDLLENNEPLELYGNIIRQFRLLLLVRELLDGRAGENEVISQLDLRPFVARKLIQQAGRFNLPDLEVIYHRLLEMDLAMKTSQMAADVVLDTFIASLVN